MRGLNIRGSVIVAAAVVALVVSGCAAEDDSSAGNLEGDPLTIGVYAALAGTPNEPASEAAIKAVEKYVNEEKGGINGRSIQFDICRSDGTPELIITCTHRFIEDDIPVVFDAMVNVVSAAVPALSAAEIPIVGAWSNAPSVTAQPYGTSFYWNNDAHVAPSTIELIKTTGASTAALSIVDSPEAKIYFNDLLIPTGEAAGVEVIPQYATIGNINHEVLAARALTEDPDIAGVFQLPEDDCTGLLRALRGQGYEGPMISAACTSFVEEMGGEAAGTLLMARAWLPATKEHAPPDVQEEIDVLVEALAAVGEEQYTDNVRAVGVFAGLMTLANVLSDIDGEITSTSTKTQLEGLQDYPAFLQGTITCDGSAWPSVPGACSSTNLFLEVQEDGSLKPVSDGLTTVSAPS
ncbi:ABC transporter substrate-binding protein [Georgenia sp. SYP-B2076]|uniref:ABC transporter substrate-binding protein n=1 Tax=Georgenia sp. SYP-B2076 TaxID=2495881 RepID=UPI0013DE8783|nr:ABC transporter substrate-binding protein [Georgenia sp. SYP-B2076]